MLQHLLSKWNAMCSQKPRGRTVPSISAFERLQLVLIKHLCTPVLLADGWNQGLNWNVWRAHRHLILQHTAVKVRQIRLRSKKGKHTEILPLDFWVMHLEAPWSPCWHAGALLYKRMEISGIPSFSRCIWMYNEVPVFMWECVKLPDCRGHQNTKQIISIFLQTHLQHLWRIAFQDSLFNFSA